nr:hypothetical protein [uncultured Dyadobacter sp.]
MILSAMSGASVTGKPDSSETEQIRQQSIGVLRQVLATQHEWVKVHAAEYLIWAGHPAGVQQAFLREEKLWGAKPQYRIGIWRVLAQAATTPAGMKLWTDKIRAVFLDSSATDRTHAAETLAKLKISPLENDRNLTANTLKSPVKSLALYTLWSIAFTSPGSIRAVSEQFFKMALAPDSPSADKVIPAYALRQLKGLSDQERGLLADAALAEPGDSPARIYLLSAAFTAIDQRAKQWQQLHKEILEYRTSTSKGHISEMAAALAERGSGGDIALLLPMLDGPGQFSNDADRADVAAAAAHAILKIMQRKG